MFSEKTENVEFVSYNGEFPNLCRGELIIRVNGKEYNCGKCLDSGGECYYDDDLGESVMICKWTVDESKLPIEIKHLHKEIEKVVNENVEFGCCGGCF